MWGYDSDFEYMDNRFSSDDERDRRNTRNQSTLSSSDEEEEEDDEEEDDLCDSCESSRCSASSGSTSEGRQRHVPYGERAKYEMKQSRKFRKLCRLISNNRTKMLDVGDLQKPIQYPTDYGWCLGNELIRSSKNIHRISSLHIDLATICREEPTTHSSSTTVRGGSGMQTTPAASHLTSLVEFVQKSNSLKQLSLHNYADDDESWSGKQQMRSLLGRRGSSQHYVKQQLEEESWWLPVMRRRTDQFVNAIMKNLRGSNTTIREQQQQQREIMIGLFAPISLPVLTRLLRSTPQLTKFRIDTRVLVSVSSTDITAAFGSNKSLQHLTVCHMGIEERGRVTESKGHHVVNIILSSLKDHLCLTELHVMRKKTIREKRCSRDDDSDCKRRTISPNSKYEETKYIIAVLRDLFHLGISLQHIILDGYWFKQSEMQSLVMEHFLEGRHPVTNLTLQNCTLDVNAANHLPMIVHLWDPSNTNNELVILDCEGKHTDLSFLVKRARIEIVPDTKPQQDNNVSTHNEKVLHFHEVNVPHFSNFDGLCSILGLGGPRVCLPTMDLLTLDVIGSVSLISCLPSCCSLRELTIAQADFIYYSEIVLDAIRQAAGLLFVSMRLHDENYFEEDEIELIEAYCRRNQVLGTLLKNVQLRSDTCGGDDDTSDAEEQEITPRELIPHLLRVAQQTKAIAPNSMFKCLLALGDSIVLPKFRQRHLTDFFPRRPRQRKVEVKSRPVFLGPDDPEMSKSQSTHEIPSFKCIV